ncbi:MAG: aldehyde dehydrogenase family protein [Sandaracinaceae bacterium]|nr:aldehyde dehydrogenase family protein [Sandaracinaceae bacterium]
MKLSPLKRAQLLERCIEHTLQISEEWVEAACRAKAIDPNSPTAGEEWLAGPMVTVRNLRLFAQAMRAGGEPAIPKIEKRGERFICHVFPGNFFERLLFGGFRAEVWIERGHSPSQGEIYRRKRTGEGPPGRVALVLGAGNVSSIGPMDALSKLILEDQVVILKTNPVNAYLEPFWEEAFRPLVEEGFFAVVRGDAEVGKRLCHHPEIASIHITGSDRTYEAIRFGTGPEAEQRKRRKEPLLRKPITAELGAVTPCIVVPGNWSVEDIRFQAEQVASMVVNNASFNCNACKVLILSKRWPLRQAFLEALEEVLAMAPPRKAYYPGAQARYQAFLEHYPNASVLGERTEEVVPWTLIPNVPPRSDEYALRHEAFCGVLAEVSLDAANPGEFMAEATRVANESCWGTLSCTILIDPETARIHARSFEAMIEGLRYGGVAVNSWSGLLYGLVVTTWGAYPGHSDEDIQSGRGVVHNAYLIDHPEKSVLHAPFRIWPKPPWFFTHPRAHLLGRALTHFEARPSWNRLIPVLSIALRS